MARKVSLMLGHAVDLTEEAPGEWGVWRHEVLNLDGKDQVVRTFEPIGGEPDHGRRFFSENAVEHEIIGTAECAALFCGRERVRLDCL